jgi:hypothetical protein
MKKLWLHQLSLKGPDFPVEVDKKGLFDHVVSSKEKIIIGP